MPVGTVVAITRMTTSGDFYVHSHFFPASPALALDVYYGFEHALPADNATEVVTNIAPAILMTGETADEMLLTRASDGQEVPSSVTNYAGIYQLYPTRTSKPRPPTFLASRLQLAHRKTGS